MNLDAPYAVVWLHCVSCGSSLFGSQEKYSFICSCHWAQMHSESAKSEKNGNVYFQIQRMPPIHWTAKKWSRKCPRIPVIHKHWFLTCWCLAHGSGGGSHHLYSFYDFRQLWRPDICWMTGSCALFFFFFGFFQSFSLYYQRWNDSYLLVHQVLPSM